MWIPVVVVSALNRMVDDASLGRTIFYDIYTDAQKQAEPSRKDTGLFFFRGKPGAPFAIIAPGGGFEYVASLHEGFPYAVEISKRGYNAFVLKYRAGQGGAVATEDLAAAISYVFRNAGSLGVTTAGYSLWGSSAGARMVAAIGSHGTGRFGGSDLPKPSALVTLYTGHSDLASTEPPTFVAVGDADGIAPPSIMEKTGCGAAESGDPRGVSQVPRRWSWLRAWRRYERRRMDRGRCSLLGGTDQREPSMRTPWLSSEGEDEAVHGDARDDLSVGSAPTEAQTMSSRAAVLAPPARDPRELHGQRSCGDAVRGNRPLPRERRVRRVRAGARTAWHSHPGGQILIVTAGTGRVQQWGGPIRKSGRETS